MTTAEQLAARFRLDFEAWNEWDVDRIVAQSDGAGGGLGFGFRSRDVRPAASVDDARAFLQAWFGSLERYRIEDIDVGCAVDGDIATVWGFFTEDFMHHGENPERVRVRFSGVLHHRESGWRTVWNHRDIQEFTAEGAYVKKRD